MSRFNWVLTYLFFSLSLISFGFISIMLSDLDVIGIVIFFCFTFASFLFLGIRTLLKLVPENKDSQSSEINAAEVVFVTSNLLGDIKIMIIINFTSIGFMYPFAITFVLFFPFEVGPLFFIIGVVMLSLSLLGTFVGIRLIIKYIVLKRVISGMNKLLDGLN